MPVKAFTELGILPIANGGTGATILSPELIAREACRILEQNITHWATEDFYGTGLSGVVFGPLAPMR